MVEELTDTEAGVLFKHLLRYVNDLHPEAPDRVTQLIFEPIKQTLKRDLEKWGGELERKSESGALGNLKRWHTDLHSKVLDGSLPLTQAVIIAKARKTSGCDKNIAPATKTSHFIADNVSVNVSVSDKINISPCFIDFWELYDKKVGDKAKLKTKFEKLSQGAREKIMLHVPQYKASQPDKKFRKDPQTYLNAKAWEDEIINNNVKNLSNANNNTTNQEPTIGRISLTDLQQFAAPRHNAQHDQD